MGDNKYPLAGFPITRIPTHPPPSSPWVAVHKCIISKTPLVTVDVRTVNELNHDWYDLDSQVGGLQ